VIRNFILLLSITLLLTSRHISFIYLFSKVKQLEMTISEQDIKALTAALNCNTKQANGGNHKTQWSVKNEQIQKRF